MSLNCFEMIIGRLHVANVPSIVAIAISSDMSDIKSFHPPSYRCQQQCPSHVAHPPGGHHATMLVEEDEDETKFKRRGSRIGNGNEGIDGIDG